MMPAAQTLLRQTTIRILADTAMLLPDPTVRTEQQLPPLTAAVLVEFAGPCSGLLLLAVYGDGVLRLLADNMLGSTVSTPSLRQDALGEVANILCGNLLPQLAGTYRDYAMAPARSLAGYRWPVWATARAVCQVGIEQGRIEVCLLTDV